MIQSNRNWVLCNSTIENTQEIELLAENTDDDSEDDIVMITVAALMCGNDSVSMLFNYIYL